MIKKIDVSNAPVPAEQIAQEETKQFDVRYLPLVGRINTSIGDLLIMEDDMDLDALLDLESVRDLLHDCQKAIMELCGAPIPEGSGSAQEEKIPCPELVIGTDAILAELDKEGLNTYKVIELPYIFEYVPEKPDVFISSINGNFKPITVSIAGLKKLVASYDNRREELTKLKK